ncbi:NADPH-dependent FMN reductase [Aureococcus anophagefferens]|uniref:NADPH-dependent FMN reductase n=1 Tax=Aureococcus anophagefferens TaxID=44056 RepID=A0ABR1FLW6_AURAN
MARAFRPIFSAGNAPPLRGLAARRSFSAGDAPPLRALATRPIFSAGNAPPLRGLAARRSFSAGDAPLNTVLILGSTRAKRIGGKVGAYLEAKLEERGGHAVTVLDPRTSQDGFFMRLMEKAYFHYRDDEVAPPALEATAALLRSADAIVVASPEMNHTISPGLVNLMNYFGSSVYARKPSGIATYSAGMWGGARCGVALRAYLSELGCLPVSATFQLPGAFRPGTFDETTGMLAADTAAAKSADRMLEQLEWHARAMRAARADA